MSYVQAEEEEEEGGTKTGKKGKSVPKKTTTRKTRSKIAPSSEENAEMEQVSWMSLELAAWGSF